MQYAILAFYNEPPLLLRISEDDYVALKRASEALSEVVFLEEKFDIVLENMLELEVEMLRSTEKFLLFSDTGQPDEKLILNRRIINLLTACRLYLDHAQHHLNSLVGKNADELSGIKRQISEQYDRYFGYRFMEAMRNFVQHRGYPISELSYGRGEAVKHHLSDVDHDRDRSDLTRYDITPIIKLADLKKDGTFKKAILNEIDKMDPPGVNLKMAIREYVGGISRIHGAIRRSLEDRVSVWENTLDLAARRIEQMFGSPVEDQAAIAYDENNLCIESVDVPGDMSRDRRFFVKKNALFPQENGELTRAFVSSEAVLNRMELEDTGLMYLDLVLREALDLS